MEFSNPVQVLYFWHAWRVLGGPPLVRKEGGLDLVFSFMPFCKSPCAAQTLRTYQEINKAIGRLAKRDLGIILSYFRKGCLDWHRWDYRTHWEDTLRNFWSVLPQELRATWEEEPSTVVERTLPKFRAWLSFNMSLMGYNRFLCLLVMKPLGHGYVRTKEWLAMT